MTFPRRLITPVLAAVMLVGGAAYAQDAIAEGEGEIGPLSWDYTDGVFTWGTPEGCGEDEVASPSDETVDDLVLGVADTDNCIEVEFGDSYTAVVEVPDEETEGNHGQFVSEFGKELKEIPKDELDGNRGSFMRLIAQLNLFKDDKDDDESETTLEEADEDLDDEDSGKLDKAPKEDNPNKANGKQNK